MVNCFVIYSLFFPKTIPVHFSNMFPYSLSSWFLSIGPNSCRLVRSCWSLNTSSCSWLLFTIISIQFATPLICNFSFIVHEVVYLFSIQLLFSMFLDRWLFISMICPRMLSLYIFTFLYTFVIFEFELVLSISDMVFVLFIEKNIFYLLKILSQIFACGNPTLCL